MSDLFSVTVYVPAEERSFKADAATQLILVS